MKKIAVLRCLRVSASCAGSGCLRAMNEKRARLSVTAMRICRRLRFLPVTAARKTSCPIRRAWLKRWSALKS